MNSYSEIYRGFDHATDPNQETCVSATSTQAHCDFFNGYNDTLTIQDFIIALKNEGIKYKVWDRPRVAR